MCLYNPNETRLTAKANKPIGESQRLIKTLHTGLRQECRHATPQLSFQVIGRRDRLKRISAALIDETIIGRLLI